MPILPSIQRLARLPPLAKVGIVATGYVLALAFATTVVAVHDLAVSGTNRDASGGMAAFGDTLLFFGTFVMAAVPATCAALVFLRPVRSFWFALAGGALALAVTALGALMVYLMGRARLDGLLAAWSALAVLRILATPPCALAFFLAALFSPSRPARWALLGAAAIEAAVFGIIALVWLIPLGMR